MDDDPFFVQVEDTRKGVHIINIRQIVQAYQVTEANIWTVVLTKGDDVNLNDDKQVRKLLDRLSGIS